MTQHESTQHLANRQLGRLFFAEQDRLRGGPAPELCAPSYTARLGGNPPVDRAGHEGFARAFYAAFPDLRHELELAIADEGGVTVRFVLHGTHTGSFFGIPASGRAVRVTANVILRTKDGKVTDLYGVFDEAGMLRQIGVMPGG
jgi:predicted ester cyclase